MKDLTKAEEQVMQYIWKLKKAFLKDIVNEFPEPKPAYTTISTVIRVLIKKEFIKYKTYGKTNEYSATISKRAYSSHKMKGLIKGYFDGSRVSFASFFSEDKSMNQSDLEEIRKIIDQKIEEKKNEKL